MWNIIPLPERKTKTDTSKPLSTGMEIQTKKRHNGNNCLENCLAFMQAGVIRTNRISLLGAENGIGEAVSPTCGGIPWIFAAFEPP
jgi:hypothetical protein